MAIEKLKINH